VISAVGHETDFTISDFVADLRAPTPSAAAELVVGRKEEFMVALADRTRSMSRLLKHALLQTRSRFEAVARSYVFREPATAARVYRQKLDGLSQKSRHLLERRFQASQQRTDDLSMRMLHAVKLEFSARSQDVKGLKRQLDAYNPLAVLKRGYSITFNQAGRAIRTAGDVRPGEAVRTRLGVGAFSSEVKEIHEQEEA
jgi:exodeoxyribonuclease VII large subunit